MTDYTRPDSKIIWQENSEAASEPALLVSKLDDGLIEIQQEDRWIIINRESVPELCKLLKQLVK